MGYVRERQRLSEAVQSVAAAARCSQEAAQADICQAINDGKIKIWGKLRRHTTRNITTWSNILNEKEFHIPPDLKPTDFDWQSSRPFSPWAVRREVFGIPGHWELEWIELSRTDVMNVLCTATEPGKTAGRTSRSRPMRERARKAIDELCPQGLPSSGELSNVELCRQVGKKLKELGLGNVSDDTILRVAGRRRK